MVDDNDVVGRMRRNVSISRHVTNWKLWWGWWLRTVEKKLPQIIQIKLSTNFSSFKFKIPEMVGLQAWTYSWSGSIIHPCVCLNLQFASLGLRGAYGENVFQWWWWCFLLMPWCLQKLSQLPARRDDWNRALYDGSKYWSNPVYHSTNPNLSQLGYQLLDSVDCPKENTSTQT